MGPNPFTLCKTVNRLATALLLGLPVVADMIPSYEELRPTRNTAIGPKVCGTMPLTLRGSAATSGRAGSTYAANTAQPSSRAMVERLAAVSGVTIGPIHEFIGI